MRLIIFILFFVIIILYLGCKARPSEFTIWIGGAPEELDYWEKLIDTFNDSSGHALILVRQPTYSDQRKQSLIVSLAARQPDPDLFLMDVIWIEQFIRSDWLEPLNAYMRKNHFSTEPFFQSIINTVDRHQGNYYALPVFVDVGLLYYRSDLLKKNDIMKPPATWNELVATAQKIQREESIDNPSFKGYVWQGAQYEGLVCCFVQCLASNGSRLFENDQFQINTKPNIEALQLLQDLIHRYRISPPNTYTEMKEEEVRQAFQRGEALFERNWTYAWKLHQQAGSPVRDMVAVSHMPHFKGYRPVSTIGGWHVGISRYSDNKQAAWEFFEFITSYPIQKDLMLSVGWTQARKDVYEDEDIIAELPHLNILKQTLKNPANRPVIPYYAQITDLIQRYVNRCLANKITPEAALGQLQTELNKISQIYESE